LSMESRSHFFRTLLQFQVKSLRHAPSGVN
jgi:hypothetical protein